MKHSILLIIAAGICVQQMAAQKIIPVEYNGKKYEALDMVPKGKVMWGGSMEEIPAKAAKSESDGASNTAAIVAAVADNTANSLEGKPYAAKLCSEAVVSGKDDWYLPSKEETDALYAFKEKFAVEERGTIWTSTEAAGTLAVTRYWYTGAFYSLQKTDSYHFICIRKVE